MSLDDSRLQQQINFLVELDKLKTVYRRSFLAADPSRRENDAEHMWHVAVTAQVLAEYSPQPIDVDRVVRLMLVHDVVEIDAGDISVYFRQGDSDLKAREQAAARRIFGLLPSDQAAQYSALWQEFEDYVTPEARFAHALDRLIPLLLNYYTGGKTWKDVKVDYETVVRINRPVLEYAPRLWEYVLSVIDECVARGYLKKK